MSTTVRTQTALSSGAVAELREAVRGTVLVPGDAGYADAAPIWNGMFDAAQPALIVQCAGAADVLRAIGIARSEDLEIAVRSGGHSIPGFSTVDGGIVIDLSGMRGVRVDPAARRATVQPGLLWQDLDAETQAFGLASTGGLVSTTGVAGFTLGGGIGWLVRKQGLAADHLIGADVATADGRIVRAGDDGDPELLWGLRGGSGNFGVVTSMDFALQPVGPTVIGGPVFFAGDRAEEIAAFFREWTASGLPDELTTILNLTTAPPAPFLPPHVHGHPIVAVVACFAGDPGDAEAALAPLRAIADPIADLCGPIPYVGLQQLLDPLWERGMRNHMKAGYLADLSEGACDALLRGWQAKPSPNSELHIHQMGGAFSRVPREHAAFPHRDAPYVVNLISRWADPAQDDAQIAWGRDVYSSLAEHTTGGAYINFLSDEGPERVRAAYGDETYARLQALKRRYDPDNAFHRNQNIQPA
ncbi:MAG: FAD-binding oxidoreductase [Solirubrobacteraceae bacterium]